MLCPHGPNETRHTISHSVGGGVVGRAFSVNMVAPSPVERNNNTKKVSGRKLQ